VTAAKLRERGIERVADVAAVPEAALVAMLGLAAGRHVHALAHNLDPRPVEGGRRRRSIGSQRALGRRPKTAAAIDATVVALADRVTRRMRAAHRLGRTVVVRFRFDDFSRATRSHTLPQSTADTPVVLATARALLGEAMAMVEQRGLTMIGLSVANLDDDDAVQLALPLHRDGPALDVAMDLVREKFGSKALTRAVLLGQDPGLSVPMLPD
jgi:DNA polymerase IV